MEMRVIAEKEMLHACVCVCVCVCVCACMYICIAAKFMNSSPINNTGMI